MSDSVTLTPIPTFIRLVIRFAQLVGLCVLIAAVYVLMSLVSYVDDAVRMRGWTPVEAKILSAEYEPIDGNAGPQVLARYQYRYNGVEYEGTRVDTADGVELIGDFQERMASELAAHMRDGTRATAYVNPDQPEESVLYPGFYWTVFAVRLALFLVMAFFGGAFFWWPGRSLRRYKRLDQLSRQHPKEPWLWHAQWAERRIPSTSKYTDIIFIGLGLLYLLVVLPVGLFVLVEWEREITTWPGIVLMIVGLMMFNLTRLRINRYRRFGRGEFQMSTPTGVIGGALAGVVTIPHRMRADKPCRVTLECVPTRRGTEGRVLWRTTTVLDQTMAAVDPYHTAVPIYLTIDYECDEWDWSKRFWRLMVGPDLPGFVDYAQFEVPVFRTAESTPDFEPDRTLLQPYVVKVDAARALGRMCRVRPMADGGEEIRFSYFNTTAVAVLLVLLAAIGGAMAAMIYFGWHPALTIVPGMFGAVLVLGLFAMLLWGSRIEIRGDEVTVTAGHAPFRKQRTFTLAEIGERVHVEACKELEMETRDWHGLRLRFDPPRARMVEESVTLDEDDKETEDVSVGGGSDEPQQQAEHLIIVKRLNNHVEAEVVRDWLEEKLMTAGQSAKALRTSPKKPSLATD